MFIPPVWDPEDRFRGLKRELAGDVDRIVEDLEFRREFLREIWSVSRDRGAFLDTITGKWQHLDADDLLQFPSDDVVQIDSFYRALEDFQLYLLFTEDMPATLIERYDRTLDKLKALGQEVIERLGGAPERDVVDDPTVHQHVLSFFRPEKREPSEKTVEENLEWTRDVEQEMASLYVTEGDPVFGDEE